MKKLLLGVIALLITVVITAKANAEDAYNKANEANQKKQEVAGYLFESWNQSFQQEQTLPNGFVVRIVGVGTKSTGGVFVRSGVNAVAQVFADRTKQQSGNLKSIKLIHHTQGYGIIGQNGVGRTANFEMVSECTTNDCYLNNQRYEPALIFWAGVTLRAEVKFDNGTYTIYSRMNENQQKMYW